MRQDPGGGALEQLYKAVLLLASEAGQIEDRLALAYFKHIQPIETIQLPPDRQPRLESLQTRLHALYPVRGVIDGVDRDIAVNLAMEIMLLYDDLNH